MKKIDPFDKVYHELSVEYGQTMTSKDACRELGVSKVSTARKRIPFGWKGATRGLTIATVIFAQQFVELQGRISTSAAATAQAQQIESEL